VGLSRCWGGRGASLARRRRPLPETVIRSSADSQVQGSRWAPASRQRAGVGAPLRLDAPAPRSPHLLSWASHVSQPRVRPRSGHGRVAQDVPVLRRTRRHRRYWWRILAPATKRWTVPGIKGTNGTTGAYARVRAEAPREGRIKGMGMSPMWMGIQFGSAWALRPGGALRRDVVRRRSRRLSLLDPPLSWVPRISLSRDEPRSADPAPESEFHAEHEEPERIDECRGVVPDVGVQVCIAAE